MFSDTILEGTEPSAEEIETMMRDRTIWRKLVVRGGRSIDDDTKQYSTLYSCNSVQCVA